MLAYKLWGKGETPESTGMKPDHFAVKYYAMFGERAKQNPELEDEAREMLKLWEAGDKVTIALWKKMNAWVYEGWKSTYKSLGVKFDTLDFESAIYKKGKEIIAEGLKKGVFEKDENGNCVVKFSGLPDKVVLRADGTAVYATTDLALAKKRMDKFRPEKMIYVVGSEQDLYFSQLFEIFRRLDYYQPKNTSNVPGTFLHSSDDKFFHLSYGLVLLPEGRLKSREGVKVDADEIVEHLTALSREDLKSRYEVLLKEKEIDRRSRAIALAALKFNLLNVTSLAPIHFNPKESLAFTGKTGPYLQYVYARINSILKKAGGLADGKPDFKLLNTTIDRNLITALERFPELLEAAALEPAAISNYLYELSRAFSDFYESEQILKAPKDVARARIALIRAVQIVLARGLNLLGIETLKEM
jgi:arginyl-tRNA synthetase